ncbi:MAG: M20 family metallopeptidase [Flavobacteriales bacterium]
MESQILEKIKAITAENRSIVLENRRWLHQHPELSFEEVNTSEYIQKKLTELGIEFTSGIVKTGVVGIIKGKNPESKVIALRADMDALPILEENNIDYKSINEGVMHACGHDVHSASLLGVAAVLSKLTNDFEGSIKLIFQPGEEKLPGGASLMIKEGVLENPSPSAILGQHVFPDLPAGKVGFRPGMYMASCDELYLTVKGKGGHAALPHKFTDTVLIACEIISSLQTIVSRHAKPYIPSVLSFGKINTTGGATNIIPDEVKIEGTFRTMNEEWRTEAHQKMIALAQGIAQSMGGTCEFEVRKGYPFLKNNEETTRIAKQAAIAYLGKENVVDLDLRMTGEDFSYYTQSMKGCFYRLGTGESSGLHTSTFNVNESSLELGVGLMSWIAINMLNEQ